MRNEKVADPEHLIAQYNQRFLHLETRLAKESLGGFSGAPVAVDGCVVGIITAQLQRRLFDSQSADPTVSPPSPQWRLSLDTLYALPVTLLNECFALAGEARKPRPRGLEQLLALFDDPRCEGQWVVPTLSNLDTGAQMPATEFASRVWQSPRALFGVEAPSGSGKSTLIEFLGRHAMQANVAGPIDLVPLYVNAASWVDAPDSDEIFHFAVRQRARRRGRGCELINPGFYTRWPDEFGIRFMVLVEGLDELDLKQQRAFEPHLQTFASNVGRGDALVLVTRSRTKVVSRTLANELAWHSILPFSDEQQRQAVERWQTAVSRDGGREVLSALPDTIRQHPQWLAVALAAASGSAARSRPVPAHVTALYSEYERHALPEYALEDTAEASFQRAALQTFALWSIQNRRTDIQLFKRERLGVLAARLDESPARAQTGFGRLMDDLAARRNLLQKDGDRVVWRHASIQAYFAASALVSSNEEVRKAQAFNDQDPVDVLLGDVTYSENEVKLFAASMLCDADRERLLSLAGSSPKARKLVAASAPYGFELASHGPALASSLVSDLLGRRQGKSACSLLWELYDGAMPDELRCMVSIGRDATDALADAFHGLQDVYFLARVFSSALAHVRAFDALESVAADSASHAVVRTQALRALFAAGAENHVRNLLERVSFVGPMRRIAEAACRVLVPGLASRLGLGPVDDFRRSECGGVFWLAVAAAEENRLADVVEQVVRGGFSLSDVEALLSVAERYEMLDAPCLSQIEGAVSVSTRLLAHARERQSIRANPLNLLHEEGEPPNTARLDAACLNIHAWAEGRMIGKLRFVVEKESTPELRAHAVKGLANIGAARTLRSLGQSGVYPTEKYLESHADIWFGRIVGMDRSETPWW
ncbi:hypothetical protein LY474_06920 [Myxococcus stipitatus]|uniref:NACHT domain-containing protein n=1 Tax=Myxococcus stipitatus TaxID=83455 RepID=UPI001F42F1A6|nr:hypothetical protein [Myxococcus stipitatus]MCE9667544.1 hypothetical protein [Myxococcus stipitatus]